MISAAAQAQVLEPSDMEEEPLDACARQNRFEWSCGVLYSNRDPARADVAMPFLSSDNLAAESEYRNGI